MKKKIIAILTATMMMASVLVGCGGSSDTDSSSATGTTTPSAGSSADTSTGSSDTVEQVSLKIWTPENQRSNGTIESMAESFQALNPQYDISYTFEIVGEDIAKDEVMKDVDSAADVFFYANDQMVELVDAGILAKLGGSTLDMINDTMSDAVVGTVTNPNDDSVYGIPFTHNTFFMYYDKTLLDEEDVKSLETILAKDTGDDVINYYFESGGGWKLAAYYYGAGNTIYGESQSDFAAGCDWNNETGVAVTEYIIDLMNNPKCAFDNEISIIEKISNNQLGAWFDGAWNYDSYKAELGDNLGLAVLPTFNVGGEDKQLKGFYGSKVIGVNSHSSNLAAAVQFAAYLGGEEMQVQRFLESSQIPTNSTAGSIQEVLDDPIAAVTVAEVEIASVTQPLAAEFGSRYWTNVGGLVAEIKSGTLTKDNVKEKLDLFCAAMAVE